MATSISSIGVGSGLPLNDLLQQLRTAENAPLAALQSRIKKEDQRLSAYSTLKSSLENLSKAATALGKSETFNAVKTSVTGETFTATAKPGSGAIAGNHSISVQQLAAAQVLASGRAATNNQAIANDATGMVNITFMLDGDPDNAAVVSVNANASLQDIAKAINDSELDFSATLMNDGDGYRLIVSANSTGASNNITNISVAHGADGSGDISSLSSILNFSGSTDVSTGTAMGQSVTGRDAQVTINGITVISADNELEDAIEGVTLTLTKPTAAGAEPDSLQLTRDDEVTTKAVDDFVKAYNALQNTIKSLTSYDVESQTGAALTGDSLARRVQSQIRDSINGLAANGITLTSIGIKTNPNDGTLSVDTDKLNEALANNRADLGQLFTGEVGLSQRVTAAAEIYTKSDGLLKTSQDGIESTIRQLKSQYERTEMRIDQKMETYRAQFVQLDTYMTQMNGISSYLNQQLSMLGNMSSSSNK